MKLSLCLSGQPRQFCQSFEYIKRNILDVIDTDIFIYCWNAKKQPHFEVEGAIRYPDEGSIEEFINLYKPKAYYVEEWNDDVEKTFYHPKFEKNKHPHVNIVRYRAMLYMIYKCNKLKNEYCLKNGQKYDVIVKGRSDIAIKNPISLKELENAKNNDILYTDVLRQHDQMPSDILFWGNKNTMDIACNLWKNYEIYYDKNNIQLNTEIMFPYHLKQFNIQPLQSSLGVDIIRPSWVKWT